MRLRTSRLSLRLRVLRLLLNNSNLFMIEIGRGVAFATPLFFYGIGDCSYSRGDQQELQ